MPKEVVCISSSGCLGLCRPRIRAESCIDRKSRSKAAGGGARATRNVTYPRFVGLRPTGRPTAAVPTWLVAGLNVSSAGRDRGHDRGRRRDGCGASPNIAFARPYSGGGSRGCRDDSPRPTGCSKPSHRGPSDDSRCSKGRDRFSATGGDRGHEKCGGQKQRTEIAGSGMHSGMPPWQW